MERYCGLLASSGKSRRSPYISISYRICDMAQLNQIKVFYNLGKALDLNGQSGTTDILYHECKCSSNDRNRC
jgi:hypothetical protein